MASHYLLIKSLVCCHNLSTKTVMDFLSNSGFTLVNSGVLFLFFFIFLNWKNSCCPIMENFLGLWKVGCSPSELFFIMKSVSCT